MYSSRRKKDESANTLILKAEFKSGTPHSYPMPLLRSELYYTFTLSCKEQWANIIFSLVTIWPANYYGRQEGKEFGEMTTILAIALEVKSKFMTTVQSFVLENKSYLFLYDWYVCICYFMSSKITISYITTIPERDLIKVLEPSTSAKISTPHWQVGTLLC